MGDTRTHAIEETCSTCGGRVLIIGDQATCVLGKPRLDDDHRWQVVAGCGRQWRRRGRWWLVTRNTVEAAT